MRWRNKESCEHNQRSSQCCAKADEHIREAKKPWGKARSRNDLVRRTKALDRRVKQEGKNERKVPSSQGGRWDAQPSKYRKHDA